MEQIIWDNLMWIKGFRRDRDRAIKFVNTQIGLYRLNAERNYGFVRRYIHRQANDIENKLNEILEMLPSIENMVK